MKSVIARLMSFSIVALVVAPAFAAEVSVQTLKVVSKAQPGRTVVKADGKYYMEMQASELNKLTALEVMSKYPEQMREAMSSDDLNINVKDNQNYTFNLDRSGYYSKTFYGVSLKNPMQRNIIKGVKYTPSKNEYLTNPGARSYIVAVSPDRQGAVLTGNCGNPDGTPRIYGYNRLRSGCFVAVKIFRQLGKI